mgnify:CR=1 FL=1
MNRITKQVIKYMSDLNKDYKKMKFLKHMKKEVDIGATGTHKYRIKEGPNKGIVV